MPIADLPNRPGVSLHGWKPADRMFPASTSLINRRLHAGLKEGFAGAAPVSGRSRSRLPW